MRSKMSAPTPPPTGWAVRSDGEATQYMLALCADTAEEAEAMAADEAQRFVVEFATTIAEWILTDEDGSISPAKYDWRSERYRMARMGLGEIVPFKQWRSEQIVAMAQGRRPMWG